MRATFLLLSVSLWGCRPAPQTLADACYELGTSACARLAACDGLGGDTEGACRSDATASCCAALSNAGSTCALRLANVARFERCNAAISTMTCGQTLGGLLPVEACSGWAQP